MRKLIACIIFVVAIGATIVAGVAFAAESSSPWVLQSDPIFQNVNQLPPTVAPAENNIDCSKITTRLAGTSVMQEDCVVQTIYGLAGTKGLAFNGSSESIPLVPPPPFTGLFPVQNQSVFYTFTSASGTGLYMHFYRLIRTKMKPTPDNVNGRLQYTLTQGPDLTVKNLAGKSQPVNAEAMAFSQNGDWMIVDFPFQGFVRINLETFEITPFAPSMNQGNDYGSYSAQLSIGNDGRHAVVKPVNASTFKIYDLSSCSGAVLPVSLTDPKCESRDYWPFINSQLQGLKAVYQPRFTADMQLSVTAQYEYSIGRYQVAQFKLTAPGENPRGSEYLGLGDSYASGEGAFNYMAGTDTDINKCHLSSQSYPILISAEVFSMGRSVACSGARMKDVNGSPQGYRGQSRLNKTKTELQTEGFLSSIYSDYAPGYLLQSDFLHKYSPQTITISIGGNDIGFADIVKKCVMPTLKDTTCFAHYEDQQELVSRIQAKENDLKNTYRAIGAVGRRVYVIGYPQIVAEGGRCASNVHLDQQEIRLFIDLTEVLNNTIKKAAIAANVQYVDVSDAFVGHRMCEPVAAGVAVNGITAGNDAGYKNVKLIGAESYHPNALGHLLLKQAILRKTNTMEIATEAPTISLTAPIPYSTAPKSGRTPNLTIPEDRLVPDIVPPLVPIAPQISGSDIQLKSSSTFPVRLDDSKSAIGTVTTDASGAVSGTLIIPDTVGCGMHTLHIYGQNMANQPIDILKEIVVAPESGCAELTGACGPIPAAGQDIDEDGVDDACDPVVADPPQQATYRAYLTGSSIRAVRDTAVVMQPGTVPSERQMTLASEVSNDKEAGKKVYAYLVGIFMAMLGGSLYLQFRTKYR